MDEPQLRGHADAKAEVMQILSYNGIEAVQERDSFRFLLSSKGVKWEMLCCPTEDGAVILYGIYPFRVTDEAAAHSFCRRVNDKARYGAMLLQQERLTFRIGADLFDPYCAYETLGRALEYCAGIMTRFWVQAAAAARHDPHENCS